MGLTSQERLSRVGESAWAHKYVCALNNRVPTLKCANGAYVNADREIVLTPEAAERIIRVLEGDESAACRRSVLSDKEE